MTLAALLATKQFVKADVFTIQALNGQAFLSTNVDMPVYYGGNLYSPYGIGVDGLKFRRTRGLSVDEQQIQLYASRDMLVNGIPWFDAIAQGFLDTATIRRDVVIAETWEKLRANQAAGIVNLFDGFLATIDSIGPVMCEATVKTHLVVLNQPMPHNTWQPSCIHTVYDSGCGLNRDLYRATGTVGSGSTKTRLLWTGAVSGYHWQGKVMFLTGLNAGLSRTIKYAAGGVSLDLASPLPNVPGVGDQFYAWAGCDYTNATCNSRFANTPNFRACRFIPPVTTAL